MGCRFRPFQSVESSQDLFHSPVYFFRDELFREFVDVLVCRLELRRESVDVVVRRVQSDCPSVHPVTQSLRLIDEVVAAFDNCVKGNNRHDFAPFIRMMDITTTVMPDRGHRARPLTITTTVMT